MRCDAHIHLFDLFKVSGNTVDIAPDRLICASAHAVDEFLWQEQRALEASGRILLSFGIHPQEPRPEELNFLERLIAEGRLQAIGECGFDLFNDAYRADEGRQLKVWDTQLELAIDSGLPLVIHSRKALPRFFADTSRLKKVSSVIFHGWPGSAREALSFLDRGVNAWFSVGKALLRGDRSLAETVSAVSVDRLLTETDAPYMTDRLQAWTTIDDIDRVSDAAARLAGIGETDFLRIIESNFRAAFSVRP